MADDLSSQKIDLASIIILTFALAVSVLLNVVIFTSNYK